MTQANFAWLQNNVCIHLSKQTWTLKIPMKQQDLQNLNSGFPCQFVGGNKTLCTQSPQFSEKNQVALVPVLVFYEMKPAVVAEEVLPEVFGSCRHKKPSRCFAYPLLRTQQDFFQPAWVKKSSLPLKTFRIFNNVFTNPRYRCSLSATFPLSMAHGRIALPMMGPPNLLCSRTSRPMLPAGFGSASKTMQFL